MFGSMFGEVVTLSKKQARLIVLVFVLCFTGAFFLSYGYVKYVSNKKVSTALSPTPVSDITSIPSPSSASLTLSADKTAVTKGDTLSVEIGVDSENSKVEAADFVIKFDNNYLAAKEIKEGQFFGVVPVKTMEKDFVKVSGMASLAGDTIIVPKGKGTVATIVFEALEATGSTSIQVDRDSTIIASSGKNILDTTRITDLTVEIK